MPTPSPMGNALLLPPLLEDDVSAADVLVCVTVERVELPVSVGASLAVDVSSTTLVASEGIVVMTLTGSSVKTCVELLQSQPPNP